MATKSPGNKTSPRLRRALYRGSLVSLAIPFTLLLVLSFKRSADQSLSLAAILALGLALLFTRGRRNQSTTLTFSIGVLSIGLVWPEVFMRWVGFSYVPEAVIELADGSIIPLQKDRELLWVLPASTKGLNSQGFFGDEIHDLKNPSTLRLAYFGDSCTQQGFPRIVQSHLREVLPDRLIESLNFAVSGYSSHQGKISVKRRVDAIDADIAILFFGWNDHWQAFGVPDHRRRESPNRGSLVKGSRLLQRFAYHFAPRPTGEPRVSLERFRDNLESMGQELSRKGSAVFLMTAPSSHQRLGVPDELVEKGHGVSKHQILGDHSAYAEVVRDLTEELHWELIDLEYEAQIHPKVESLFLRDGIHFSDLGLEWVGERVLKSVMAYLDR